jgi:cytochrome c oxidase subunit 3
MEQSQQGESGSFRRFVADWTADREAFRVRWSKAMMWIFLLGDAFVFGSFLSAYAATRIAATAPWPDTGEVFGMFGIPLFLVAIMTVILLSSGATMALAVVYAMRHDSKRAALWTGLTSLLGAIFVSLQAVEWTNFISEGFRPWAGPAGEGYPPQFGASFFMLTGFHGLHVTIGVILLAIVARKISAGIYEKRGDYLGVELAGLYWGFVDLVWVFLFPFFYLF